MVNLNQSNTPKSEKDYWRTPKNLINDAIGLLNTWQFSVDVCAKDADTSIGLATAYIDENIDALSPSVEWDEDYIVKMGITIVDIYRCFVIHHFLKNGSFSNELSSNLNHRDTRF
ncbi:hypothetical protein [Gilliamella apicola]|uniref:hypothetical protein n=1 Tax=Gilliamella apicola TaxID=1196095 RepID=UPI002FEE24A2